MNLQGSFRINWLDFLAVQGTLKNLLLRLLFFHNPLLPRCGAKLPFPPKLFILLGDTTNSRLVPSPFQSYMPPLLVPEIYKLTFPVFFKLRMDIDL